MTDVSNMAQLLLHVRYVHESIEEFLFCRPLESHARGKDIFVNKSMKFLQLQV